MSLQISYGFFPLDGIILPTGRQDNAIPKHKTLRREPSSDSLNHQKEIELGFIWIWNEAQVNFKRATRKLCLSLKPVWTEAYFNGKWSLFQWQMKPISSADEAYLVYCISKIVRDKTKIVRDAWGINAPFFSICHSCCFLSINNLSGFFLEIVMGDRWFGKNIFAFSTLLVLVLVLFQYYLDHTFSFRFKIVILFSSCNSCWCISFWITVQRYGFFSAHSELSRRFAKIIEKKCFELRND